MMLYGVRPCQACRHPGQSNWRYFDRLCVPVDLHYGRLTHRRYISRAQYGKEIPNTRYNTVNILQIAHNRLTHSSPVRAGYGVSFFKILDLVCVRDDVIKWKHFPRYWPVVRGNSPPPSSQRVVTRSFDVFFDLCLNKRLSKLSRRRWFETPWRSLWRHCNAKSWRCCIQYCVIFDRSITVLDRIFKQTTFVQNQYYIESASEKVWKYYYVIWIFCSRNYLIRKW